MRQDIDKALQKQQEAMQKQQEGLEKQMATLLTAIAKLTPPPPAGAAAAGVAPAGAAAPPPPLPAGAAAGAVAYQQPPPMAAVAPPPPPPPAGVAVTPPPHHQPNTVKTFRIADIDKLPDKATYRQFRHWREDWDNNALAQNINAFPRDTQVFSLTTAIGAHGRRIVEHSCKIDVRNPTVTVDNILHGLDQYFRNKSSRVVAGVNFAKRKQQHGESFDQFWFALKDLAEDAELCNHCRDEQIVRQIVIGVQDDDTRSALEELKPFPTLDQTITLCNAKEGAAKVTSSLANVHVVQDDEESVQSRSSYPTHKYKPTRKRDKTPLKPCSNCGGKQHALCATMPSSGEKMQQLQES